MDKEKTNRLVHILLSVVAIIVVPYFLLILAFIASLFDIDTVNRMIEDHDTYTNMSDKDLNVYPIAVGGLANGEYIFEDPYSSLEELDQEETDYHYRGAVPFLLLQDKETKQYKLMELNPEFWNKNSYLKTYRERGEFVIPDFNKLKNVPEELKPMIKKDFKRMKYNEKVLQALRDFNK